MLRFNRRDQAFAIVLASLAGYVDAIGFLKAGGFFASFMSGNSTRLAVGLVRGSPSVAIASALIASFIVGVILGTLVSERSGGQPKAILLFVATLLTLAAAADLSDLGAASVFIAAAAMGAENATFSRDGDVQIGLTYMTGTLVKFVQRLTHTILGRDSMGWLPLAYFGWGSWLVQG